MTVYGVLLFLAVVAAHCAVVSAMWITATLDQRGIKTPFPLIRGLLFRNLSRHREVTRSETGKVGPLFYSYLLSINAVWIFRLAAWAVRIWR